MKKSRTKKVSALILLALCFSLAASSLFSCGDTVDENNTSDQASESVDTTSPEDTTEKKTETEPPETEPPVDLPDPVFMRFGNIVTMSDNKTSFADFDGDLEGVYKLNADDMSLDLKYAPNSTFGAYRSMIRFSEKDYITKEHKYIRVTYKTSDIMASSFSVKNNATNDVITLVPNTLASQGEWVTSNVVDIDGGGILDRLINGIHVTFMYNSTNENAEFSIKEIAFFVSPDQAYDYYGDTPSADSVPYSEMTFGTNGNAGFLSGTNYGEYTVNNDTSTLDITYADNGTNHGIYYMSKIKFTGREQISAQNTFVRVLYSAKMPEKGVAGQMYIQNDKTGDRTVLVSKMADTGGEFVLSKTGVLSGDSIQRFSGTGAYSSLTHNSLNISTGGKDGLFSIKAVYFFPSKESADAFEYKEGSHKLTINGNDISSYKLVISEEAPTIINDAANAIKNRIKTLTGVELPIITDAETEGKYEILIGKSKREKSLSLLEKALAGGDMTKEYSRYLIDIDGDTLVISATLPINAMEAANIFITSFLYKGLSIVPDEINIADKNAYALGTSQLITPYGKWKNVTNVTNPKHFSDSFASDDGYWQEENNAQNFRIANGKLTAESDGYALTYVHVYEKNVTASAKFSYSGANDGADMGLMLRYTADDAWVRAGYDFDDKAWYIEYREGTDFFITRSAEKEAALTEGTVYNLSFTVNGSNASLSVNGTELLTANRITHATPGRIAVYAENVNVSVDDYDAALLSGQGTIMKDIVHNKLPDEEYREGGTVFEMNDGSLTYQHHLGATFKSLDNGLTWEKSELWIKDLSSGYLNVLRLNNGDWLKITKSNGYVFSETSSDEGKTWTRGGNITTAFFNTNTTAFAGNMNDKITQSGTTDRIFYSQNYETKQGAVDGRYVFCEFFYSDDNGKTWTKSETASWELGGNETQTHFGECKILECADGTLRMYNSWNRYGCIVYSESTDNGVTWGPLVRMDEFVCACSSMQFYRDPYADNDTTYYMVWVYGEPESQNSAMARSRLSLARTTDGKNWEFLGDIWRWESTYRNGSGGSLVNHIVDPFIKVTEDYVIVGTGLSELLGTSGQGTNSYHGAQRQHIWSIQKDSLTPTKLTPVS